MDTRTEHPYRYTSAWESSIFCFKTILYSTVACLKGVCCYSVPLENTIEERTPINNNIVFPRTFDDVVLVHSPN